MQAISVSFRLFSHGCPLGVASSASYAPWAFILMRCTNLLEPTVLEKGIFSFDRGEHHGSMIIINTKTLEIDLFPRHVRR